MKRVGLFEIFYRFMLIGALAIGGGYAMLPVAEKYLISEKIISNEDFLEDYALAQALPGVIMANTASLVGGRIGGIWYSIFALIGVILPSILVITVVSILFDYTALLSKAFMGVRIFVVAMLFNTLLKLIKTTTKNTYLKVFALFQFCLLFFGLISPIIAIIVAIASGFALAVKKND